MPKSHQRSKQLGLFADRTSCHDFQANQFRVCCRRQRMCWSKRCAAWDWPAPKLANAQVGTIRLKLLKIGGRIIRSVRRIVIHLASGFPLQRTFESILRPPARLEVHPGPRPHDLHKTRFRFVG